MLRKLLSLLAITIAVIAAGQVKAIPGGGNQYRVRTNLTGATIASGKAVYRERVRGNGQIEQRFSIEVEDANPGTVMAVAVNGVMFGMIVINDLGIGELEYRTPAFNDDPNVDPIPDNFPHLIVGDSVTVGLLAGVFHS